MLKMFILKLWIMVNNVQYEKFWCKGAMKIDYNRTWYILLYNYISRTAGSLSAIGLYKYLYKIYQG